MAIFGAILFYSTTSSAQVQGISYTLSPFAEYSWFNENSGLENGFLGGVQLGLGFGEYVELRGLYSTGLSLQSDLSNFGFVPTKQQILDYTPLDIKLNRYGGEMKLNMSKGEFLPYFTIGTGIQSIGIDTFEAAKQIYVNAGAGIKISAGDRYTLGLQAVNHTYNYNAVNSLMSSSEKETYGLTEVSTENEKLSNWSARASLVLYIGGRRPGEITDIDRAYFDNFSGGFQGLNIPLEANISKMDFHEDLPYRDTWMGGVSAGLNFGPLVGVRGFYWKSFEDGIASKFDDLSMYGGEARFKLNEGKGFTPWITIGGGNIHVEPEYTGVNDTILVPENKGFAMGGFGVNLPFSKYVNATGFVRSVLTTSQNIEDLAGPDQLNNSWNYGVSLNFNLGKNQQEIEVVKQDAFDAYILSSDQENAAATEELKNQYENRIKALEAQLSQAVADQDLAAVKELNKEKTQAEQVIDELNKSTYGVNPPVMQNPAAPANNQVAPVQIQSSGSEIRMSPAEFQLLIREILEATRNGGGTTQALPPAGNNEAESALSDFKKELQLEKVNNSLNELKTQISAMTQAQGQLAKTDENLANELSRLIAVSETSAQRIQNQIDKSNKNIELLQDRQMQLEKGLSDKDLQIQSFQSDQLNKELEFTNRRIEDLRTMMITTLEKMQKTQVVEKDTRQSDTVFVQNQTVSNRTIVSTAEGYDNSGSFFSKFHYRGMSGFAGFSVGGSATFNLGYRLHYQIGSDSSNLEFMPESFFGFGSPSSFGITANGIYHLDGLTKSEYINPYVGLGVGFMKIGDSQNQDKLSGALNFIVGTSLNVWAGDMYVDFTARNLFKYNQLVVGYRFPF